MENRWVPVLLACISWCSLFMLCARARRIDPDEVSVSLTGKKPVEIRIKAEDRFAG